MRRRRARQFSGFLGSSSWVVSGSFCVLGSEFFFLGCSWRLLRLEIFIFLLGLFQVFRNFNVKVWGVSCVIGLGSLVPAFFFLVLPTPPAQCWARGGPFCLFAFFSPSCRLFHSVLGQGLGNLAAKLMHGTVGFSGSLIWSSCRRPPQLRAGGCPG